jgi:transposase
MGCTVHLELHVRRFFCSNQECARQIFTERLPTVVAPYARRTTRLADVFTLIGFALGGEAGKRLVAGIGLHTSPDTLLRLIQATPEQEFATPRVLGVDDWSYRRGTKFGTILLDLEKRIPVDLLPDREVTTFARWLEDHAGIEVISRDRGTHYIEGAKQGAPKAQQVTDRFHLLVNLSETLQQFFLNKKTLLKEAMPSSDPSASSPPLPEREPWHKGMSKRQEEKGEKLHQERVERYHQIHELHAKKVDTANIGRQLGVSRRLVYHYLQMQQPPERTRIHHPRISVIEAHKEYIIKRWNDGCRNAQQVYRELQEQQGYAGSDQPIVRLFGQFRKGKYQARTFKQVEPDPAMCVTRSEVKSSHPPTPLKVARWMSAKADRLLDWQKTYLTSLCQADPTICQTYELVQEFASMLRERQGERLDTWLQKVEQQGISELQSFAQGLLRDYGAVKAGLTLEWSQGAVEGHVHRLKLLKRQAYGRASFQMLRKRVLRCS